MQHRVSQRQPQACIECTKRKRKCDKRAPCGRCVARGLPCAREIVRLRKDKIQKKNSSSEQAFLENLLADLRKTESRDSAVVAKVSDRLASLHSSSATAQPHVHDPNPEPSFEEYRAAPTPAVDLDTTVFTLLESLAWGRSKSGCFPHHDCACHHRTSARELLCTPAPFVASLPPIHVARSLVRFHLENISWHHNCLHGPTFLRQCEEFWATGKIHHPQWLALYLVVLSSSIQSIANSERIVAELGVDLGNLSPQKLFHSALQTLHRNDFLQDLSIFSVQAIVISTEVSHNLGYNQLNAVLFAAATRIAQCLGLHKIVSPPLVSSLQDNTRAYPVDIEVGRRIWCQMTIQDLFAIPFNDTHGINPAHCTTERPTNCDDDLIPQDEDTITVSSYCRVLVRLALLMPDLTSGLGSSSRPKPLDQQYQHILERDKQMRDTVQCIPSMLLRDDPREPAVTRPPWLTIARRTLAVTAADKIIMIHRPFLFRAFQSSGYAYTRRTCVAAAITILREHEAITNSDDISIWTHTAFCITATLVLSLEVLHHRRFRSSGDVKHYQDLIRAARERLDKRKNDVLAARGVKLLDVITTEGHILSNEEESAGSEGNSSMIDLLKVMERFIAAHVPINSGTTDHDQTTMALNLESTAGTDCLMHDYLGGSELSWLDDFEVWYDETFQTGDHSIR